MLAPLGILWGASLFAAKPSTSLVKGSLLTATQKTTNVIIPHAKGSTRESVRDVPGGCPLAASPQGRSAAEPRAARRRPFASKRVEGAATRPNLCLLEKLFLLEGVVDIMADICTGAQPQH